jgi:hypothetical protein
MDKPSSNQSIAAILRDRLGTINPITSQPANSKEREQRKYSVRPSKQDRSSSTIALKRKSNYILDDDSNSDSDKGIERSSDLSNNNNNDDDDIDDDDDDDRGLETRKPRGRVWSALEEQRLRAYRKVGKDWSWIASKFGQTDGTVKQHWGIMNRDGSQGRKKRKVKATG